LDEDAAVHVIASYFQLHAELRGPRARNCLQGRSGQANIAIVDLRCRGSLP